MTALQRSALIVGLAVALLPGRPAAQGVERIRASLIQEVMPGADRFDEAEGDPPVKRAFRGDELIGYVFLTSDLPPEERGYSGPIRALVGMAPDGTLTGVRVIEYHETYMRTKGDFLRTPGFQEQFEGKYIGDRFKVYDDVDGISRVSISVRAMARGVRDAARRVAAAYPAGARPTPVEPVEDVTSLTWFDMRARGVTTHMDVTAEGEDPRSILLIHLESEELASYLLGGLNRYVVNAVERRGGADQLVLYVVEGDGARMAVQQGWSIEQDGVTTPIPVDDVVMLGAPWDGLLAGETSLVGALMLDDDIDLDAPLTFVFERGPEATFAADYTSWRAGARGSETESLVADGGASAGTSSDPAGGGGSGGGAASSGPGVPEGGNGAAGGSAAPGVDGAPAVASAAAPSRSASSQPLAAVASSAPSVEQLVQLDFTLVPEETPLERLLANTSWSRVGWISLVLALATLAFFVKRPALRWVSLATTFVVLGFVDGGFLSVSHITGVIWVGPSAVMNDLPLLMMVVFTVATVLLWGRIFCGFLCPFGALQDFIDRLVPARWKRELPRRAHRVALKAKYGVLAVILVPALAGSEASIYQYFEPFGTVFFLSRDVVLWTIAGLILAAAVVVPRFYCRYACPLGAALALGSVLSLRRIPRVEQCDLCKVCETKCPTGAIDGPSVDFKECVRCNVCEVQLIERTGVCRHDMETIRPRLAQLKARKAEKVAITSA